MTHKSLGVVKPQHNQSRQKANNKNYVIIAPLSESGAILDLPCPSFIPSFHHSTSVHHSVHHSVHPHQINFGGTFLKNCKVTKL